MIGVESSKNSNIWDLKDFDKSIRDMNAIKANATGVIFPIKINEANIDKNKIIHKISMFNDTDIFYTFPIPVPLVEEQL